MSPDDDQQSTSDDAIRVLVARLSRPGPGGCRVIERAAILAEGASSSAILDWLAAASWVPESAPEEVSSSGLHGRRGESERGRTRPQAPRRYLSPPV